jgi:NAD(P)-dependent dehydrogenase (short-subunit alcohol dehydrogenase family)
MTPFGFASTADDVVDGLELSGKQVIVTGGASGIGLETARALANAGAEVTLAVRNLDSGEKAAADIGATSVRVRRLDLADRASIGEFVAKWTEPLHILVNNAGIMALPELQRTPEGFEMQFATNFLGHFALMIGLRDSLVAAKRARIVSVSSSANMIAPVFFDDLHFNFIPYTPFVAYGQSKTAAVLLAVEATRRWAVDGIFANALNPGAIATNLQRHTGGLQTPLERRKSPEQGARDIGIACGFATPGRHRRTILRGLSRSKNRRASPDGFWWRSGPLCIRCWECGAALGRCAKFAVLSSARPERCGKAIGGTAPMPVENPKDTSHCKKLSATPDSYFKGARLMSTPGLLKCAGAVVALVIVSACGTLRQAQDDMAVTPSAATLNASYVGGTLFVNGSPVTAARLNPLPRYAELVPDKATSMNYEYIFNHYDTYAGIFDYPKSVKQIGTINGAGGQGCTNVLYGYGKKIFWNAGRTNDLIDEYEVPKKLLKTLSLSYTFTSSCAMNTSGDLAVGVLLGNSYGPGGQVVIFKNATGSGRVYKTPLTKEYFCGYDPSGNLFADGFGSSSYDFGLVELPKGSSKFVTIKTSNSPRFPGSVQWDGTYLTVFDQYASETYQYKVSGTTATLKNTVQFTGASDCAQTWIVTGLLYCGDAGNDDGEVFKYPAGGSATATFTGNFDVPLGVTAAKK